MPVTIPCALRLVGLEKTYELPGGEPVPVLKGLNLEVPEGDYVAIMGPSGSGKSTLLNLLGCLDQATGGLFELGGQDVSGFTDDQLADIRATRLGFVFQSYNLIPQLTVQENIETPLFYSGLLTPESQARCHSLANKVGLGDRLGHRPPQLSGGQQQRAGIARALVNEPQYILADEPTGNLDTVTTGEILLLLDELNEAGKTIMLVTHEEDVARRARRIVRLRDGIIVSDERLRPVDPAPSSRGNHSVSPAEPGGASAITQTQKLLRTIVPESARWWPQMLRTITLGLRSLGLHPLRSFLTILGIFIGVGAVIWLLAIGEGISAQAQKQIASLGANNLISSSIQPPATTSSRRPTPYGVTQHDLGLLRAAIPQLAAAVPMREQTRRELAYEGRKVFGRSIGTTPEYGSLHHLRLAKGRFLSSADEKNLAKVAVIAPELARELFRYDDPIGRSFHVSTDYYEVIGVLSDGVSAAALPTASSGGPPTDSSRDVYIPLSTLIATNRDYLARNEDGDPIYTSLTLSLTHVGYILDAAAIVRQTLKKSHPQNDYALTVPLELLEQARQTRLLFIAFMGLIAAISLLVGGIGIMNIMLATVTERTREIGIRRALGAQQRDITRQFLVETAVLSAAGGVTGLLAGLLCPPVFRVLLWALEKFFPTAMQTLPETVRGMTPIIVGWSLPLAAGIALAIGILFGLYPARRAAAMDPIQALRHVT
jgi:macrolide transport system ATP-binding/permease protein